MFDSQQYPLVALSDQKLIWNTYFLFENPLFLFMVYLQKLLAHFLILKTMEHYFSNYWSD